MSHLKSWWNQPLSHLFKSWWYLTASGVALGTWTDHWLNISAVTQIPLLDALSLSCQFLGAMLFLHLAVLEWWADV